MINTEDNNIVLDSLEVKYVKEGRTDESVMSMELNDVSGCQMVDNRCQEMSKYVREDVKELTQKI